MLRFGPLELRSNLFLSPLAGYTNLPFRLTLRELGGLDLCTTDLVNARSLLERRPRAFELIKTCAADSPLAVQIFGSVPEEMRAAAQLLESLGIASIDINMGCPVKKVCKVGGGSAMMTEIEKTTALVRGIVDAVKIPVTAKMRLGWDEENLTAPDLARALEDAGVAAVFVHGRTREQGFSGRVNLAGIRAVVQAVKRIPVIGNGDVTTPEAAKMMLDETGCAGVSVGRGAFYNPWLFVQTRRYLDMGELLPEPGIDERLRVLRLHHARYVEMHGDERGTVLFRRVASWYARRFGPAREFKRLAARMSNTPDFEAAVAGFVEWRKQFLDEHGELRAKFRPAPMVASFMQPEGEDAAESIPVPKGPVDHW
ncbi:MAG TPA: tRNA dihydrouridine synthase DusB [Opitutaceae bacterium]|nr:tRNA dihydrouridine synthase DusB [Opitutaceae bacterium]